MSAYRSAQKGREERTLRIVRTSSGEVMHEVDVTGKTERQIEKIESGMLINLNRKAFHVEDSSSPARSK